VTVVTPRRPYAAYAGITGTFLGGLAIAGALAHLLERDPREQNALDLAALGLATFKTARTITRDDVASFIREPFVEGEAGQGDEHAVDTGDVRQALGELVTCSRCIGTWVAGALATTQILAPRFGRVLTWTLAAAGLNDWLQAGFAALTTKANQLEQRAE
jgi:hypothetical protein